MGPTQAAGADIDPDRVSFTKVLRLVRRTATDTAAFPLRLEPRLPGPAEIIPKFRGAAAFDESTRAVGVKAGNRPTATATEN
ncbi:MAG: hypothetical protein DLM60_01080 [Pseudonocardiales bacterium]|nr:hypothetical protein [Actinomycetota bacterium]PZS24140.1 MAG: hypothetical protein DLM60_01080 [Pseudonocardiales bacterium]